MEAKLPDLQKIYETANNLAYSNLFADLDDCGFAFVDISLDTFRQTWMNTGCGWTEPMQITGQALTEDYTTVASIQKTVPNGTAKMKEKWAYVVFFGNKGAYTVTDPKPEFFEDLKNRRMLGRYEALHTDRYSEAETLGKGGNK